MTRKTLLALLTLTFTFGCKDDGGDDTPGLDSDAPSQTDADGDGYWAEDGDCDDGDATVNPGATELCDGRDNNCDGLADEGVTETLYSDDDGDSFGDAAAPVEACAETAGLVADNTDCDDGDGSVNPDAVELCDGRDNDCDSQIDLDDPSLADGITAYGDADGDTYGDANDTRLVCALEAGLVTDSADCDDGDAETNPAALERCGDKLDNNCDGGVDEACPTCDELNVIQFFDSFSPGSTPLEGAQALLGFTLSASNADTDFAAAYDGGTWDVVVVDVPGGTLSTAVVDRVEDAIGSGAVVLFSYWYLGYASEIATVLGVSVSSSLSSPLPLSAATGSDLWTIYQTLPSAISDYSHDAGINGVVLSPLDAGTSEVLGLYSDSQTALLATFSGQVIVNGHLPWDFQATDDDGDGVLDMAELYANELVWTTGCAP